MPAQLSTTKQRTTWAISNLMIIATLALGLASPAHAKQVVAPRRGTAGGWRVIGTVEANFSADHDTLVVPGYDDFRRIKFKVTNAGLNLQRLVVVYENGEPEKIDVRANIPEGGESRQIDLRGAGKRRVRRIDFWYDTKGILKGRAHVTVVGMK
jgi:hypothetical protein